MVSPSHWAALPNPVATDIRSVHGFCRRCVEFHVQLSGFLHQQVMPQLCGCRPTKPDIQRCWKHMCTSRAYVHPLTTCRNGEIHRESFQTYVYTPARMCFCRESVCILYIYVYILSYYVFLIFLVHSFTLALATPPVVWRIGSRPALACRRPQLSWWWQTNLRGVWTIRNADFICSEPVESHERWESRPTKLKSNHSMRILNMA